MARRAPKGEVKRRIIFGGHTDAANEWTYSLHGGIKSLAPVMVALSADLLQLRFLISYGLFIPLQAALMTANSGLYAELSR